MICISQRPLLLQRCPRKAKPGGDCVIAAARIRQGRCCLGRSRGAASAEAAAAAPAAAAGAPLATAGSRNSSTAMLQLQDYAPPEWASHLSSVPSQRYRLAMLPTPIHEWRLPGLPEGVRMLIKRDDLSGMQASGNKVRKLEFILAEAKAQGADCIITIGGIQSNHARATAVVARYLGLDCHLILRTRRQVVDEDPGLVGNLLVGRLVGAHLHLVTKEEYGRLGSDALLKQLKASLEAAGRKPYVTPVGGSSPVGTWGYLQAVQEIVEQDRAGQLGVTDIAMACGSGGTTAGLALGSHMSGLGARVHAYGVCDTPDYFYDYVDGILQGMGATPAVVGADARALVNVVQARGLGYAMASEEELRTVQSVAATTGVILDPVYSGKAVHAMLQEMRERPDEWRGRTVLFIHTGGLLGMYDKLDQLGPLLQASGPPVQRMLVPVQPA